MNEMRKVLAKFAAMEPHEVREPDHCYCDNAVWLVFEEYSGKYIMVHANGEVVLHCNCFCTVLNEYGPAGSAMAKAFVLNTPVKDQYGPHEPEKRTLLKRLKCKLVCGRPFK